MASARLALTFLLVLIPLASAQETPRKTVKSAGDLPAFSYPAEGNPAGLIRSEEAFRPIGRKLPQDIQALLRAYIIEDRVTLRGLHYTLLHLNFLENRTDQARKELETIRNLEDKAEDKADAKLISGVLDEALLDSGGTKANPAQFLRRYSAAIISYRGTSLATGSSR
jgi:hypothetical protein